MSLQDYRPMMERCSNCSACKFIPFDKIKSSRFSYNCPSVCYYNFNTYSARGRFQLGLALLTKDADYTDTVKELVHDCMACGSCDVSCKVCRYNLEPLEYNLELKADMVKNGKTMQSQKSIIESLKTEKTMLVGTKKAVRTDWAKDLGLKDLAKEKAEAVFFPGCKYSYDETLKKTARTAAELLLRSGVDLGYLGNADNCCTGRAYQMGFQDIFVERAHANIRAFEAMNVKTIVTPCSDCYHTFKRFYAKRGMQVEVLHTVEYLAKLLDEGKLEFKKRIPMTVTYHDPCHLGRQGEKYIPWDGKEKKILNQIHTWEPRRPRYNGAYGIYNAPRRILASIRGIQLAEMERIREYAWCCGAGGGCSETNPDFSAWTAKERITEANATGAEALVTACPWCKSNFANTADENGNKIPVFDIVDLVMQAL